MIVLRAMKIDLKHMRTHYLTFQNGMNNNKYHIAGADSTYNRRIVD